MNDVTGGDLLTLWRLANVHLPYIADVFSDGSALTAQTANAEDAFGRTRAHDAMAEQQRVSDDSPFFLDALDPELQLLRQQQRAEMLQGVESPDSLSDLPGYAQDVTTARTQWETEEVSGRVYPHWARLRNELQVLLAVTAENTMAAAQGVNLALNTFRGVDEANAAAVTEAGQDFDSMLLDETSSPPTGENAPQDPVYPDGYERAAQGGRQGA